MKRRAEEFKDTDNRSVYKKLFTKLYSSCPMCSPNKGCNKRSRNRFHIRTWKKFRKTKYKI